ncbi:hypothetical protein BDA96_10G223600 [Sorghum bicolor]|uniref:Uncharacterized protein n=2 Tax=Sorghum bicolor TaxID=4558 RepID=A0A921Q383_SORBI|nr:hypothetical protein BDA96_10G223600 [Sorghum bicolor]OQU76585.1 hypothetical protein SORBI_3010G169950 [Sorghum bicolor]
MSRIFGTEGVLSIAQTIEQFLIMHIGVKCQQTSSHWTTSRAVCLTVDSFLYRHSVLQRSGKSAVSFLK